MVLVEPGVEEEIEVSLFELESGADGVDGLVVGFEGCVVEVAENDVGFSARAPNTRFRRFCFASRAICSSLICILHSAKSTTRWFCRRVRSFVKMSPKVLNKRSHEAELGQMDRRCMARRISGGGVWPTIVMSAYASNGLRLSFCYEYLS